MQIPPADTPAIRAPMALVLDTNVVLDWLVFHDPSCRALDAAVRVGQLHWHATEAMREELEHVLTRQEISSRLSESATPMAVWAALVRPEATAPASALRCRDADDQKFIDLALQLGNALLLSRDRAVLALARQAQVRAVDILTVAEWSRRQRTLSG
jgi:uncharacterized protein